MMQEVVFLIDLDRCMGCRACEVACKQEHDLPVGLRRIQVIDLGPRRVDGTVCRDFVPLLCFQCSDPHCVAICPAKAISQGSSGVLKIDETKCVGCGLCMMACPYGAMGSDPDSSKAGKCDFCASLREKGLEPSCVSHCPGNALSLGEASEFDEIILAKYSLRVGRVVYVSQTWKLPLAQAIAE